MGRKTGYRGTIEFSRGGHGLIRNPSCFEQHFASNLAHRTIVAGKGEIFHARTVQNGVQRCGPSNKLLLKDSRLAHLDPLPHGSNLRSETTNDRVPGCHCRPATFQCGTILDRTCYQESPYSEGSVVFADASKIAVHYRVIPCARRQMRKTQRVKVNRRVRNVVECQHVGCFAQNAGLACAH